MEKYNDPMKKSEKKDKVWTDSGCKGEGPHSSVNLSRNVSYAKDFLQIKEEPEEMHDCIKKEMKDELEVGLEESETEHWDYFFGCLEGNLTETSQISLTHTGLPQVFQQIKVETQGNAELNDMGLETALIVTQGKNMKSGEEDCGRVRSSHKPASGLKSERIHRKTFGCGKEPVVNLVRLSPEKVIPGHHNLGNFEDSEENLRKKFGCEREAVVKLARLSLGMTVPMQGINSKGRMGHIKETVRLDSIAKILPEGLTVAEGPGNHLNNKESSAELNEAFPVRDISDQSSVRTVDKSYLNQDRPVHSKETQFTYDHCLSVTNTEGDMNICNTQNRDKKSACDQCSFGTNNKQYLRQHHLAYRRKKKFACDHWPYQANYSSLNMHCLNHSNIEKSVCGQCSHKTNYEGKLNYYCVDHSNIKKFACDQCPYETNCKNSFTRHCLNHTSVKKFACDQCPYRTNIKRYLTRHCLSHSNLKKFACQQCSYETNRKDHLTEHCLIHDSIKKFACDKCSYKTSHKSHLAKHRLNHTNVKRFACDQCSYKTNCKSSLTLHCLNHSSVKKYSCDQCSYKTNCKSSFNLHCCIHNSVKIFACDQCSYRTNVKRYLIRHCLSHTNLKKFTCQQCSYETNRKDHLAEHCLIHSNIKKFACDQCSYKTSHKSHLTKHCLNHSNIKNMLVTGAHTSRVVKVV